MRAFFATVLVVAGMSLAALGLAGDAELAVATASGVVDKVEKGSLTVQPREAGGKFGKKLVLKITGTSKLTHVSQEKRAGKVVAVQRDADVKDLEARQAISLIYSSSAGEHVLLSAVVHQVTAK